MENRAHKRARRKLRVRWDDEEILFESFTRDICPGGLFIVTSRVVPLRRVIELELSQEHQPMVRCLGRVMWVNNGQVESFPPGFGIEFLDPCDGSLRKIAELCAQLEP